MGCQGKRDGKSPFTSGGGSPPVPAPGPKSVSGGWTKKWALAQSKVRIAAAQDPLSNAAQELYRSQKEKKKQGGRAFSAFVREFPSTFPC